MSTVATLIDDGTGLIIPDGADYFSVTVMPCNPGLGRMNTYRDMRSIAHVVGTVRRALCEARLRDEPPPRIEITGRTHHKL